MENYSVDQLNLVLENYEFIICDKKVYDLYSENLKSLELKNTLFIDDPESSKSFESFQKACEFFLSKKITRSDQILVIGGGATSDLGGFVAMSLLRGISWSCLPTTILSYIDASIGGKTAINTLSGKNLVGGFHKPSRIYTSTQMFSTLCEYEVQSAFGELIKYALLDKRIFNSIVLSDLDRAYLLSREYKLKLVKQDPLEDNIRKLLNLGHTFGHCYEKILSCSHGLAVRMGMSLICRLYSKEHLEKISILERKLQLEPLLVQVVDRDLFIKYLKNDKKIKKDKIDLIIPKDDTCYIKNMRLDDLIEELDKLNGNTQIFS